MEDNELYLFDFVYIIVVVVVVVVVVILMLNVPVEAFPVFLKEDERAEDNGHE